MELDLDKLGPSTRAVHAGEATESLTRTLLPPIFQTSTFALQDAAQGAALFAEKGEGYIYTRTRIPVPAWATPPSRPWRASWPS